MRFPIPIYLAYFCIAVVRLFANAEDQTHPPVLPSNNVPAACEFEPCGLAAEAGGDNVPIRAVIPASSGITQKVTRNPAVEGPADRGGVDWPAVFRGAGRFLAVEHGFRLLTEPHTRVSLKGGWLGKYARAAGNLHGWADGDGFHVNYVGHPMQGSVSGFIWAQNDRNYRHAEFGKNPIYWKSRLRAAGFMWAYSTQFEIGPLSEASIGAVQVSYPQQGFVDHVITPTAGLGWMVAEDAIDQYVIRKIEAATSRPWIRLVARTGMNPTRTFANMLQGSAPWHRYTREGILAPRANFRSSGQPPGVARARAASPIPETSGPPPFEFSATFQPELLWGGGKTVLCLGGGATVAFRIAADTQFVTDVSGCNLLGLAANLSGDSLTYMAGPRWVFGGSGAWSAHWQLLAGGNKVTEERMWPQKKKALQEAAIGNNNAPSHAEYSEQVETNGFAIATGGGLDYKLNRALAIRVAEISYRHSWIGPVWGNAYTNGLKLVSGVVLRMGTW